MNEATEMYRRQKFLSLNRESANRAKLQERHGQVWDHEQMQKEFSVRGFLAPYVMVTNKETGARGVLEFQNSPRFYFRWTEERDA